MWAICPALAVRGTSGLGDKCTLLELIFISSLCEKHFSTVLDCVDFLGVSDTKMQWAELFGLLFLVAGIMMSLAILHVVGVCCPSHLPLNPHPTVNQCMVFCSTISALSDPSPTFLTTATVLKVWSVNHNGFPKPFHFYNVKTTFLIQVSPTLFMKIECSYS